MPRFVVIALVLTACGDNGGTPMRDASPTPVDGPVDAPIDADPRKRCDSPSDCGSGEACCILYSPGGAFTGSSCAVATPSCGVLACDPAAGSCTTANGSPGTCHQDVQLSPYDVLFRWNVCN